MRGAKSARTSKYLFFTQLSLFYVATKNEHLDSADREYTKEEGIGKLSPSSAATALFSLKNCEKGLGVIVLWQRVLSIDFRSTSTASFARGPSPITTNFILTLTQRYTCMWSHTATSTHRDYNTMMLP